MNIDSVLNSFEIILVCQQYSLLLEHTGTFYDAIALPRWEDEEATVVPK